MVDWVIWPNDETAALSRPHAPIFP